MGFIAEGNTLNWEEAKKHANFIRQHGIIQFLNIYSTNKDRINDPFTWGDEVEYILVEKDEDENKYKLKLRGDEVLEKLFAEEKQNPNGIEFLWRPEYGRFMLEGTPAKPYLGIGNQLTKIEENLMQRRKNANRFLKENESIISLANYPRLGCKGETKPEYEVRGFVAESQFLSDKVINPHFRFSTLTANIRTRRGKNVSINIPMFRDINTPAYLDQSSPINNNGNSTNSSDGKTDEPRPYNIYMDAMGFGMGCCCLQTTFQLSNIDEARAVYDPMAVFAPIMLSLTAASSIFKGFLSDIDARWTVISQSVDDRTDEERGLLPLHNNKHIINKSRYDSIDSFISRSLSYRSGYDDLDLVYDKEIYNQLIQGGIDQQLSKHFAHLFIRDPLVIYSDKIDIDDTKHSDHFENIQSTNWQTVRFKPPSPGSPIGWRVEFRPMEVQLTDFENAAFIVFISLVVRAVSELKLNFYIPISKVDENLKTAHFRDSCRKNKFYFRKNINDNSASLPIKDEYELMTINEIFNGKDGFDGIINVIKKFVTNQNYDEETLNVVNNYLNFISARASGELLTMSSWTREFVTSHPAYKHDSCVTDEIQKDYLDRCLDIYTKKVKETKLLGNFY